MHHPVRPTCYPRREWTPSGRCQYSRSVIKPTTISRISFLVLRAWSPNHVPGRHARAQLSHSHGDALDEKPTDQPTPDHSTSASVSHAIIQRGCERRQQSQNGERNTEGGPEREFSLEFLLVTECYQSSFVCGQAFEIRDVAIGKDCRHRWLSYVDVAMAMAMTMSMAVIALNLF